MDKVNWDDFSPVGGDASVASTAGPAVDWGQFEPVKPTSFGRKLADIGTSFASGALGSTKAITDAAGAGNVVSNKLDGLQNSVTDAFSPARRAERAARQQTIKTAEQSGSVLSEVGAHLGGFAEAPVSAMAEAAGSVVPVVASMFTPAGRSAAGRALLGVGLGAAQGAGSVKGTIYDAVQQRQADAGATPERAQAAADAAQAYTGPNAGSIAVGTGLGVLAARSGLENTVSRALGGHAAAGGASVVRRAVVGAVAEGLPEAAQGGQERLASNLALQKEGFDVPTWQGVAGQAAAEGVAGGALGAGVNAMSRGHARTDSAAAPAVMDPMDDPSVGAEPASPIAAAPVEPTAAPAIDPTAGPVSKAAAKAGDLGLAPDPAPVDRNASILSPSGAQAEMDIATRVENLPIDARREGRFALKSLQSNDLPPGVRAFHEEQLRSLVGDAPAAVDPIGQQPVGGIERTRDARASASNPLDLALEPVGPVAYDGGIDFPMPPAQPSPVAPRLTADEAAISDLGLQRPDERLPAAAMRLPEANRLRVQAAEQGIALSVIPHESGRGYAVVPTAELAPGQRNQTGGMLPLDRSLSGRMVAGADGVRQEGRAEAISIRNTEQVQRDQVQAERQLRTDLGLSNVTPVRPVSPDTSAADLAAEKLKRGWTAFSRESQTLNVPRAEMPQIKSEHRGALVNYLAARGIASAQGEVPAGNLKPTQAEFSPAKVEKAKSFVGGERSILVSSDGYVVDGHHQWLAKMAANAPVKVIVLNAPIADLLPTVRKFPSATTSGSSTSAPGGSQIVETKVQDVARRRALLASLDRGGIGTRAQKVEARLLNARDRLARQQAYPNVNKQEQQAAVAGLRLELADLDAVAGSERGPGEGDLGGHTRSGLQAGARQEVDVEAPGGRVSGHDVKEPLNQALAQTKPARDAINSEAKPDALVKMGTNGFGTVRVKQSDLDSKSDRIPTYTANGQPTGRPRMLREYLDPTGEKLAASNANEADNPLFDVIQPPTGGAFKSIMAAKMAQNKQGLKDSHEVVTARTIWPDADGFVLRRKPQSEPVERAQTAIKNIANNAGKDAVVVATGMHKDPGEPAEAVTPAVVDASMAKAGKVEGRKPSAMRAELLGEIDQAIQDAPDYPDFAATVKAMGEKDAVALFTTDSRNGMGEKYAPQGYSRPTRTFDIVGDGKFTIRNTVRQLLRFRKSVTATGGFRDAKSAVPALPRTTDALDKRGHEATIKEMLAEGDYQAAEDFAAHVEMAGAQVAALVAKLDEKGRAGFAAWKANGELAQDPRAERRARQESAFAKADAEAETTKTSPDGKSAAEPTKKTTPAASKIDDFGEKLAGARKDYAALLTEATTEDIAAVPLSKSWPEPDYQKLLDAGSDKWTVAFLRAARDAVPTKPQTSWKLQRWVSQVETVRNMAEKLLTGAWKRDAVEPFVAAGTMRSLDGSITLYLEMGHTQSLKGLSLAEHSYSLYKGQQYSPPKSMWTIEQKAKATAFGNWPRELATGDTRAQAIAAFKAKIDSTDMGPKSKGQTQFEIYRRRATGSDYIIGKKIGREHVDLKQLPDLAAARKFMAENAAELEAALARYKETPLERRPDNQPRVGDDHRNGAPVSPEAFASTFGFRGVQFGNYVEQGRRQSDLNETYDALMDLAAVLGVPARSLSLNGRLGLAFGARGKGGKDAPAAHYEPDTVVINLTKGGGPGSLAHEWWHSLDNYFAKDGGSTGFATDGARIDKLRAEMQAAFNAVRQATQLKSLRERSRELDKRKSKPYWNTPLELSARSFETYVIAKLQDQGAANDYLANVVGQEAWDVMDEARAAFFGESGTPSYPYPTTAELPAVRAGFDNFFRTVQTREDDAGNVALFRSGSPPPERQLSKERVQALVDAAIAGISPKPSIEVFSDPAAAGLDVPANVNVSGAALPDGRIQVFQSGVGSELDVARIVFHELFHRGVQNVLAPEVYTQTMLDLAAKDSRIQAYADEWKSSAAGPAQRARLQELGFQGSNLTARHSAMAVEEGLARVAEELRAEKATGSKPSMRIRVLANWLAGVADKLGMPRLARAIRAMTYNDAEKFVMQAIDRSGERRAGGDMPRFRSDASPAERAGEVLKGVTITNLKKQAGFKATDYMGIGLQFLGRRQLVDVYDKILPQLRRYSDLMARMDADKNEAGAGADQLAEAWGKLPDERALAELMHDATLAQMDPAKALVDGDNAVQHAALRRRFQALTPAAQAIYTKARDQYGTHMKEVRNAIKERIERSEMRGPRKAELLKQMDDEFYGRIKGVYFPLARFGQYVVVVKDAAGKAVNVSRAETMAEADATRQQLLTPFPASQGFTVGKVLKAKDFVADRDAVGRGFMEQLYGALDKQDMNGKQRAELEDALGQLYLSALPDLSWAKHGIHRKGTPGYSQDARRAFAQNVFHGARYLAKLRYSDLLQDELTAMDKHVALYNGDAAYPSVRAQQVVDEMNKRHDAAMNPNSNPLSTALTSFGFMFHLGLSPASALVNLTQTALVAYPVMAAKWGYAKSAAALLEASKQTAKNGNDISTSLSPEEKRAYDEAVRSGVIDVTMAHDLAGIAQGEDSGVATKIRPVMKWASFMFHHAEKFNRQVTFVAAYRLARQAGADHGVAFNDAVDATYDGHFDYSSNNRPRVMQGNVARVLLLFKQYGQNMVYTIARRAQQSLKGATPRERAEARKALGGLLAMHGMAAGALGLPMVTTLLAAASMLGGSDDEPWDAQVAMQNMLADAFGQKPAEVLAHGLSRLSPWDISGRVGLDKLILPDIQEGLEGRRLGESAMAAALGPVAGIGINMLKGLQDMGDGQYLRGLEGMMPAALRGPLKAFRYGTEGVKDKSGIAIKDEVDFPALVGQAAGFSPSEVRNAYEGKSAVMAQDRALQQRRRALLDQYAMAAMAGDEEGKQDARADIGAFNEKHPDRRIMPLQLAQSLRARNKRIAEAEEGVYLPKKRRDAIEAGRFATMDQ